MVPYLSQTKSQIVEFIDSYVHGLLSDFGRINSWGADTLARLKEYLSQGKMLRGCLIPFSHAMGGGNKESQALQAAAAMELFQAALLIHDDIMDKDLYRRGKPSMHAQYRSLLLEKGIPSDRSEHGGDSLGICVGDIALFLGFELLGSLDLPPSVHRNLLALFTRELQYVGLAQMEDVHFGIVEESPTEEQILSLYRYKTGRYTFSLPLMAGWILAERPKEALSLLSDLGEHLGILFQLKDDELGLFANQGELGKPIGTDLLANKKTLYRHYLFQWVQGFERKRIESIFGSPKVTVEDLEFIRSTLLNANIKARVARLMDALDTKAQAILSRLDIGQIWKERFHHLMDFNRARDK